MSLMKMFFNDLVTDYLFQNPKASIEEASEFAIRKGKEILNSKTRKCGGNKNDINGN